MYETSHRAIRSLTEQVRTQLHHHRATGKPDEDYLEGFIDTFVAQARQHPGPALLIHTAVGLYSLALAADEIDRLTNALAMHEALLAVLTDPA